jgi:hypothetical protein
MKDAIREWDIWIPNNKGHWASDEQTYAIETGKGHYNSEAFDKIDHCISFSEYGRLKQEFLYLEQINKELTLEIEALKKKMIPMGTK